MELARRVASLKPSSTVAVTNRAKQLRRDGVDVLSFAAGEPDFDTPDRIKRAAIAAIEAGQTKYMPTLGDQDTRQAIADKLTSENGIPGLGFENVGISVGGKHSLFLAMHCLLDAPEPGAEADEVLLPVPSWVSYRPIAQLAGGRVVEIETNSADGFRLDPERVRSAITPRSRLLVLNSPSNPCGTMYSEADLRAIAGIVHEMRDVAPRLIVLTDEIYEKIVYGDTPHFSIGSVPEIADRVITLNGLSKAYAMTGWRVGYAAMPGDAGTQFVKAMGKLQGQMTTNIPAFIYPAIRTALAECADDVARMRDAFAERAGIIHGLVSAIPGVTCPRPTGAFYVFPDISAHFGKTTPKGARLDTALAFAEALLDEGLVAGVPGEDFGGCGARCMRLSFACSEEQIRAGIERLGAFIDSLR